MNLEILRRTRIKFCGITRLEDARIAVELGVDALGFVCVPGSRRNVRPEQAALIRQALPPLVSTVLLVSNADEKTVREAASVLDPDFIQFHGRETAAFCDSFGRRYWRAVSVRSAEDVRRAVDEFPRASALLLDSHGDDGMGGTGKSFDWSTIPRNVEHPLILAGGLTPANVGQAVRMAAPYAVDVSSGIEAGPGLKDPPMMRAFVEALRLADAQRNP
ncbi:MAG: phosphoribosylanthranilate isomerase [Panacagrimonas sp.]